MKKLKILTFPLFTFIFSFYSLFIPFITKAQLSGPGIEFNSLINSTNSYKNGFGLDFTYESGGMYYNFKNLFGYKHNTTSIINESEDILLKKSIIRHQIQGKYWFGNLIRANKIHPFRCAHRIKIREDYHFKPYLLIGLDNSFTIGENIKESHMIKAVTGIGTNIKKFGNVYSAKLLFIEIRPYLNIKKYNENHFENKFSLEASIGLKFY